jgi:DNA invertase Pin-like site-specific DNA recombinase
MKRLVTRHPRVAVAYLRASTDEQRLSAAAQRAHIRAWAARDRISVVGWYVDRGVCSVTPIAERPGLRAALAAVDAHRAGVLVVARRDRIARDVVLACEVERAAARAGARVVSATGEGNGDSPADAFLRTVIDGAAQYEHGLVRARTRAALAAKRARRERVGAVPYGFALDGDGVHLVVARAEQATIARARELRATGLSLRGVAATLASEGSLSRNGRPFLASQVARMVRTPSPARRP